MKNITIIYSKLIYMNDNNAIVKLTVKNGVAELLYKNTGFAQPKLNDLNDGSIKTVPIGLLMSLLFELLPDGLPKFVPEHLHPEVMDGGLFSFTMKIDEEEEVHYEWNMGPDSYLVLNKVGGGLISLAEGEVYEPSDYVDEDEPVVEPLPFVTSLMSKIMNGRNIPKVQVERYISPIFELFIEDILLNTLGFKVQLVSPEFPLKKDENNQSTNVDFLCISEDDEEDKVVFVELKTDSSSYKESQDEIYEKYLDVHDVGELLNDDFTTIMCASDKKWRKYANVKYGKKNRSRKPVNEKACELFQSLSMRSDAIIVYIVPKSLKDKMNWNNSDTRRYIIFGDFSTMSGYFQTPYLHEWSIISTMLAELDEN